MNIHNPGRRAMIKRISAAAVTLGVGATLGSRRALAADPVQLISHRYPALEFWAGKMKTALPGVDVNAQLMPFEKMGELVTIAMSSKAQTLDIVYVIDSTVASYARNGWLRPLDDLWAKYKNEFNLGDYSDAAMKMCTYNGRIYAIPGTVNVMMLYYRKDLFDASGKTVPKTVAEFQALAKALNSPMRAGTINCLKPTDATLNDGASGDFLLLVFADTDPTTGKTTINRLIGYYRDPADPSVAMSTGPVRKFDQVISPAVDPAVTPIYSILNTNVPTSTAHSNPIMLQLAQALAGGAKPDGTVTSGLFYNYYDRSVMVKGQIIEDTGMQYRRAINTYNFTVSPRG